MSNMQNNKFIREEAKADFDHAYRRSFWRSLSSWLTQNTNELLPFDEVRKHLPLKGQHYLGLRQVEVSKIVGSVNRYQDFDSAFLPRQNHTRDRWESVDRAHLQDVILPPIELYKIGDVYFVKDGNHRVSVAVEKGQVYVDAYVIEIDIPIPFTPDMRLEDLVEQEEYVHFLEITQLSRIRPEANIRLSLPGQYGKLIDHISVHRWYMGEKRQAPVTHDEAVAHWYDKVYMPLVKVIREQHFLENFPGRTEADLYLWIIEHRYFLQQEYGTKVPVDVAARHFLESYADTGNPNLWYRVKAFVRKIYNDLFASRHD